MNFYIYVCVLLLIIAILFDSLYISFYTPVKIKNLSLLTIIAFIFRYICLFILFFAENIRNLYLLKPILFLNIIGVPIIFLIVFYIFIRNNKIEFNNILKISFVLLLLYVIFIVNSDVVVNWNLYYGYTINLVIQTYLDVIEILINIVFLILGLVFGIKKGTNKNGILLIIIASSFTIVFTILDTMCLGILPHAILCELMWVITFNYSLNKVVQKKTY